MTDRKYLKEMLHLTVKLTDAANNFGYESDEYNAVLNQVFVSAARFNDSRRRRSWFVTFSLCVLICLLAWIVYTILF